MAKEDSGMINKGVVIKGELGGEIDLVVEGRVEGTIQLDRNVIVGQTGEVLATVRVHNLTVEGQLQGDVEAADSINLRSGCNVKGEIRAPRIMIERDAQFDGEIDMNVEIPDTVF